MTYFCFLEYPTPNTYMEPLEAQTPEEAKAEALRVLSRHATATAARVFRDTEQVEVLDSRGALS